MVAAFARKGGYGAPASVIQSDSAHPDHSIIVPDAQLLFTAQFHRAGPDLVLIGQDGRHHIIPGYFSSEHRPGLVAPNGAGIPSYLIDLLAGSATPGEYAQAQPAAPSDSIGRVEKVVGDVTVIRNGVAVAVNVGDVIYKSDVVQTGDHSSVGIAFPDGTALDLVANTRMALTEYSYDVASTSNVALFNLVEGGLSFIAGKVAHTGDMHIGTPVATLGIRGTAGWLYEDPVPAGVTATAGNVTVHFAAVFDQVTNTESIYTLYATDPNGNLLHDANGNLVALATVSSTQNGQVTTLSGNGIGALPTITTGPPDFTQQQFQQNVMPQVVNMAIQAIQQFQQQQQNNPTPQSNPSGGTGSSTPPNNGDNGTNPGSNSNNPLPFTQNENLVVPTNGNASANVPVTVTVTQLVTPPTQPGTATDTFSSNSPSPTNWNTAPDWSNATPPGPQTAAEIGSGQSTVDSPEFVGDLLVDAGAGVTVVSNADPTVVSSLTVSGTAEVAGTVTVDSTVTDPLVTFNNGLTVDLGGEVEAHGSAAEVFITGATGVDNSGTILADDGGMVVFYNVGVTNHPTGTIAADGDQANVISTVAFENSTVDNAGATISANVSAEGAQAFVQLADSIIQGGTLTTDDLASNAGGEFEVVVAPGTNFSELDGSTNGPLTLNAYVQVDDGANLEFLGTIVNAGTVVVGAGSGATLTISGPVMLEGTGAIVLDGDSSIITGTGDPTDALINAGNTISGSGTVEDLTLTNQSRGVIDANVADGTLTINTANNAITNAATLEATNGGALSVQSAVDDAGGTVTASNGFIDFNLGISGGTATVTDGGELEYGWSSDVATDIIGSGTLVLDHQNQSDPNFAVASYTGTVGDFSPGAIIDVIDLTYSALAADTWNGATNTLTIGNASGAASVSLAGSYAQDSFALASDGSGGTEVVSSPTRVTLDGLDRIGDAVEGSPLTVTLSDTSLQDVTYTWLADGTVVQSGTSNSYTPGDLVQGQTLDVLVGFTDPNNASTTDTVTALAGAVTSTAVAPTITGTHSTATSSEAAVTPFAGVTIGDPNSGASDTLTISYTAADGTLSGTGLSGAAGAYTLSGTAAAISGDLDALVFTPVDGVPNTAVTTTFTLSDTSSAYATATVNSTTTVTDSDAAVAPTISGTVGGQTTTFEAAIKPFTTVTIGDANNGGSDSDTLTISYTAADGTLSGTGLSGTAGDYTLSGTAATISSAIQGLTFTPVDGVPNTAVTTTFTLSDKSSAYATATVNSTTTVTDSDAAVAPTITGTHSTATSSEAAVTPFAGVTIGDPNSGASDTLTISYTAADGTLSGTGLSGAAGAYTLSGTAAAISGDLDALVFTPVDGVPNTAVTTTFTLSDTSSAYATATVNSTTTVTDSDAAVAPTISGTVGGQTTTFEAAIKPFTTVTIGDANNGGSDSDTLTISYTAADGTLSGTGLSGTAGDYTLSGTAATISSAIQGLTFTPVDGVPNTAVTTTFTLSDKSSAYATATVNSTTTVTDSDAAVAPTITGTHSTATSSEAAVTPFAGVTIGDPNSGASDTLTISYTAADGTLSGTGLSGAAGAYTLSGTAAAISGDLDALVFTPVDGVPNTAVTTTFTLSDTSSAYATATVNSTTTVTDSDAAVAPTISGTVGGQTTTFEAAIKPFTTVTIGDANNGGSDSDTLTISYTAADGTLSGTGLSGTAGDYTLSGTAATISSAIQGLTFTPVDGVPNTAVTTTFTLSDKSSAYATATVNSTTTVTDSDAAVAPTITGTHSTATSSEAAVTPFAGVTIGDPNSGASDTLTISYTAADGTLSGTGLSGAAGAYTLSGTAAAISGDLDALVFTPVDGVPNTAVTTTFTLSDTSSAYATATVNSTTTVTDSDAAVAPTISGTVGGQTTTFEAAIKPFTTVTIGDANNGGSDSDTLTISYTAADGTLSGTGLSGTAGDYTLSGTAATISSAIQGLTFTPVDGVPNTAVTTTFTLSDKSSAYATATVNSTTTVTDSDAAVAPTITGTHSTATSSEAAVTPFAGVTIGDPNSGASDTLTISYTAADGTLSGTGLSGAAGAYTLSGTAAAISGDLDALVFTPVDGVPNTAVTTTFTLSDTSSAYATATVNSTTTVTDSDAAVAPTISGTVGGQTTTFEAAIKPFTTVTIGDANNGGSDSDTLTISYTAADGTLSGTGLSGTAGDYTLSGTAATISSAIQGLTFTPVDGVPNTAVTTTFTLSDKSSAYATATVNSTTTVTDSDAAVAPTITGTHSTATSSEAAVTPFAGVTIGDPNSGASDTLTISYTAADGTLSGTGLSGAAGAYTLSGTAAAISGDLDALVFTPVDGVPNTAVTTTFTLSDTSSAYATATVNSTTTVTDSDAAVAPTISGTVGGQTTTFEAAIKPFTTVTIGDANNGGSDSDTLTISYTAADGTLSGTGLSGTAGDYTLSGTAATISSAIQGLTFTPVDGVPNTAVTTTFTLSDKSSAYATATVNSTTTVTDSDAAVAPTITGTHSTATSSEAAVTPFAGVTIGDPNSGASDTLTISYTAADGTLSGTGLSGAAGAYTLSGTAAAISGDLDALVFTPVDGVPNTAVTTTFTLSDTSSAYATATVNSTTTVTDSDAAVAPTISGTVGGQTTTFEAAIKPFTTVTIGDANNGGSDSDTLTISYTAADGTLSGTGLSGTAGDYTLSGTAATISSAIQGLTFTPVDGVPNTAVTTTFTLSDKSSAYATATVNSTTTVTDSDAAVAPTITGTHSTATSSEAAVTPFAGVTIGDPNSGASDTLTISYTAADGTLSGTGLSGAAGAYTLSGTAAAISGDLDALVFTPVDGVPNTAVTTTFTLSDTSSAYATATVNSTTTVTDSDAAVAPTISGTVGGQTTTFEAAIKPFTTVTIGDANNGGSDSDTLTISYTAADGTLSGTGLSGTAGDYTLSGTAATISSAIQGLTFTPVDGVPNTAVTTTFTLSDKSSAYATATVNSTTTVTDSDAAVAPTITGTHSTATSSEAAVTPFAGVTIGDPNSGASDTLTISYTAADGTLSGTGLSGAAGAYTLSGTAAAISGDLDALVFTPVDGVPNTAVTTTFTLSDTSSAYATATVNSTTTVTDSDAAVAPTISGTVGGQTTTFEAAIKPFTTVTIGDANNGGSDSDTLTISYTAADGTLSGTGLSGTAGDYTLSGTAATISSAIQGLTFTPVDGVPNTAVTTTFTLSDKSSAYATATVNSTTTVTDSDAAVAPTITGTHSTATSSEAAVTPFAGVTIGDPNSGASDTLTISYTAADGTLSGTGLSGAAGAYTLSGTAAAISGDLDALVFTPVDGVPNTAVTTTFTLSDTSSAYATATVNSTTTVTDSDAAVAPTISGTVGGQTTTFEAAIKPFTTVTIGDANNGGSDSDTLTISYTAADGTLSGTGLSGTAGDYTLSGTAATISSAIQGLTFTPVDGVPNTAVTTTFTLSDKSSAYATATVNSTTTVTDSDAGAQTDEWLNTSDANGGIWTDTADASTNWSTGIQPRSVDNALIDLAGSGPYIVTIPNGASATAASLTLNASNATLLDQGSLTLNGALTIDAGTFELSGTGMLGGETAITNAGTFEIAASDGLATSITNTTGTVQVDVGDTLTLSGASISGGTISIATNGELLGDGISAVDNVTIDNSGSLVTGGTLTLDGDKVDGGILKGAGGTGGQNIINIDAGDTLTLESVTAQGNTDGTGTVDNSGTILLENALTLAGVGVTLLLNDAGTLALNGATIAGSNTGETLENNANTISGTGQIGNSDGDLALQNDADGNITAQGGSLTILASVVNNGTMTADGGATLSLGGAVNGTGSTVIDSGGNVVVGSLDSQGTTYNGIGTLTIGPAGDLTGAIQGLVQGDIIDFANNTSITSTSISGSTLTVNESSGGPLTYTIGGAIAGSYFAIQSDDNGGDELVLSAVGISVTASVVDNLPVQVGQTLVATATITGDTNDTASLITYQWQISSNGGGTWTDVGGALLGNFDNGQPSSFLQLTAADQGDEFRVVASIADETGQTDTATSAPTTAVTDVTAEITPAFTYAVDDLSLVKNGTEIYNDTFSAAPPTSPTILSSGVPTNIVFLTLGSTWTESDGQAILSSTGVAPSTSGGGNADVIALLDTNTNSASTTQGLKVGTAFTISSTFALTALPSGSYGMQLTDGTSTHGADQVVSLLVQGQSNGSTIVELLQQNLTTDPVTTTLLASQTLTSTQLADNTQIEFQLAHVVNSTAITGTFELIDNGSVTSTATFAPTGTIFTGGVDWTRADILAVATPGVGLNVGAGQSLQVGQTLTASATTNDPDATSINYQWEESTGSSFTTFANIGTNSASYTVQASDVGDYIRVVATTSDDSATAMSAVTGAVAAGQVSAETSSISAAPSTVTADGTAITTLSVTAEDENGNPVSGATVTLSATGSGNTFTPMSGTTNADGVFSATLDSNVVQDETVDALINGTVSETTSVAFVPIIVTWDNGVDGNWQSASDWSDGVVPGSSTAVTINANGSYIVTVSGADVAYSIVLNNEGATVAISSGGVLSVGSTLSVSAGILELSSGGAIAGGTLVAAGGSFDWAGGTLSGVTYQGPLNLSSSSLYVSNGLTLTGLGGSGPGTLNLTGSYSYLYLVGTETLNNATINLGGSDTDYIYNDDASAVAVLTFGPSLTINQTGPSADLAGYDDRTGSGIVNEGTIDAGFNGGTFTIGDVSFTNDGTINVSNGDTVNLDSTGWSNAGTINVSGGTLNLESTFTTAQLGTIDHSGGAIDIAGTLNNAGATLNIGTGTALGTLTLESGGTIENGTIADAGSGLTFSSGTLSGVTYQGPLNLSSSSLYVSNGLTLTGLGGSGPGTLNLTGSYSYLYLVGTETLNNATINLGGSGTDYIYNDDASAVAVLTFGPSLTINQTGPSADLAGYDDRTGSGIVNEGTIDAGFNGGTFTIGDVSFTNDGTINVSNGDTVNLDSTGWSNAGTINVSGGTLNLESTFTTAQLGTIDHSGGAIDIAGTLNNAGATLNIGTGTALGTLTLESGGTIENGTIADAGSGLTFSSGTLSGVTYQGPLNLSSSSLYVSNGLTLTGLGGSGPGTLNLTGSYSYLYLVGTETLNNATINLGGSDTDYIYNDDASAVAVLTFGPSLTINQTGPSADLAGYDDRTGSGIVNEGTIDAGFNGGTFTIGDVSFTNDGTINVSNGDTVNLDSTGWSNAGTINVSGGTLNLESTFTTAQLGTIDHSGGAIDIAGTLNNAGATLNIGTGTALGTLTLESGGTIENGTIADAGSGLTFSSGTLSGVTYQGPLNLSSSSLYVSNGLTLTGLGGSGPGTLNLTGSYSYLYLVGTETLNNATINLGGSDTDYIYNDDASAVAVLTFGPSLTINQTGPSADLAGYDDRTGSGIVNEGTIDAGFNGGTFTIGDVSFTNDGTINVSNGDTVNLDSTGWSNAGTINASGGTLNLESTFTTAQLGTIDHSGGAIDIAGTLNNAGATLNIGTGTALGTLTLESGGTIENGTIADAGSGLTFSSGTLSGVTYQGPLNLSSSSLYVSNGLTLTGLGGSGPGTLNLTGSYSYLYLVGTETLNNATINLGSSGTDYIYNDDASAVAVLTFGPSLTINQTGPSADLAGYDDRTGSGIVNEGTIDAGFNGGTFTIGDVSFTNDGTINVSNGDTVNLDSTGWSNAGTINVSGGTLNLESTFTTAQLGTIDHSGGAIDIAGTLNNAGATLNIGTGTALGTLTLESGGTIENGTIADAGSGLTFSSGTLSGVTYQGPLNLSSSSLYVSNGLTLTGLGGSGPGTLNLTGSYSYLYLVGTETLNNATINLGSSGTDYIYNDDASAVAVLTFGPSLTINQTGPSADLAGYDDRTGSGIVNEGTIDAGFNGGTFTIGDVSFTNDGTINVSNGDNFTINSETFTNLVGGTLSGGDYLVSGGSTFTLPQNEVISTLAADVTLNGLGSTLRSYQTSSSQYTSPTTTLSSITSEGAFFLLGGLNANEGQAVSNSGELQLGGGNFAAPSLTIAANGSLAGFGTVSAPIANSGLVEAENGILQITGAVTGTGIEEIASGATLELEATVGSGQIITFEANSGNLALIAASAFSGVISGFSSGNEIDLIGVTANAVSYQSNFLTVENGTTIVASLNLSGSYSNNTDFDLTPDGNGGSLITIGPTVVANGFYWKSPVNGDWGAAADWNSNAAPNSSTAAVTISVPGIYSVTVENSETFSVGSLTLNNSLATLTIAGTLNASSMLSLNAGTLVLSGTISGGIIQSSDGSFVASGGTLSGVTYQGPLNLSSSSLYVSNGLTLTGLGGSGPGTLNLTGSYSYLYLVGTETLNNATINLGGSDTDYIYNDDASAVAVLTFGPSLTINQTGPSADLAGYDDRTGSGIVNEGTIDAGFNGGTFTIGDVSFTNDGTINVSNGDTVNLDSTGWSNAGTINVSGGTLNLESTFTTAQLGTIDHSGGAIDIAGTLNNAGATLNIGTGTALGTLTLESGGTIENGTIADAGSGLTFSSGTLSGVTYQGPLNLSSSSLYVSNGLTLTGLGGSGPGTLNLTGSYSYLYLVGTETLNNATINLGSSGTDYIYNDDASAVAVLTFGPSLTINQTGPSADLAGYDDRTGSGIVNEGTIDAGFNGGTFTIGDVSFTNDGTINVSNGDTVNLDSTGWSNAGTINVSGGTLNLESTFTTAQLGTIDHSGGAIDIAGTLNNAGATLNIGTGTALGTLTLESGGTIENGTIADAGSGLTFSSGTLSGVTYQGPLNLSSSSLYVSNGLTLTGLGGSGPGTLNLTGSYSYLYLVGTETLNNATINLGSSGTDYIYNDDASAVAVLTFGPSLTINQTGPSADLAGYDDRTGSGIVNEGTIDAGFNGGTFTIGDVSFTNDGTINVSNGDTVNLDSTGWSNAGTINVSGGTLNLESTFTTAQLGTIDHSGGAIDIAGTLNNAGATLNIGTGTALGTLTLESGGTIENGTIADAGSGLTFSSGTLSGVTYQGPLNLSSSSLYVSNGLTLTGLGGSGPGTLNLTGSYSYLYLVGTETLNNATINLGGSGTDYIYNDDASAVAVLTFGPSLTINQTGPSADLAGYDDRTGSGIVNEGTIDAGFNGGTFTIGDVSFTNDGTINVSNGDTVNLDSTGWSNAGTINVSGGTLNLESTFTTAQLGTIDHSGGAIDIAGTLNNAGATLNIGTGTALGTLTLESGGTIENGTIADAGSGLTFSSGTLSGVTYQGPLNLSSSSLYVSNGLTLTGLGGSGPGTLNLTGSYSYLYLVGTETLNNATINLGSSGTDYIYNDDASAVAVLTFGPSLTINQTGPSADLAGYDDRTGSGIVNEGTIDAGFNGGTFTIGDVSFTNDGTINVSNGDTVNLDSTGWSNAGTINVSGGTLNLESTFTTAQLGTIDHSGGAIDIAGTLNNAGATLNIGTGTALGTLTLESGGTIENGTIADAGSGLTFSSGTLSGVTYQGPLNLSSSSLYVSNGLTLTGLGGSGPGTLNLTGSYSYLYLVGTETLNNATINLGGSDTDYIYNDDASAVAVLTFGPSLTINQTGPSADLAGYDDRTGSGIVNEGTIDAGFNGGTFTIGDVSFTNDGTINVSNGDTVNVTSPETGSGSYVIDSGSSLEFNSSVGSGATIYFEATTGALLLEQPSTFSGAISAASGTLGLGDLLYLKGFNATYTTATPTFNSSNDTTLLLVTDSHDSLSVSLTLDGNYSADTFIASSASGGADIADPPLTATIVAGGSLDITSSSSETVNFTGTTGSLVLNDPEGFSGQIIGFTGTAPDAAHSDTIDLVGINYNSAQFSESYNSTTGLLTVTDGTQSASITFDDFNATLDFASDGDGGTLITDPPASGTISSHAVSSPTGDGVTGNIVFADADASKALLTSFTSKLLNDVGSVSLNSAKTGNYHFDFSNDQIKLALGEIPTQSDSGGLVDGQNPAASQHQSVSVTIGGPGNDNFVFTPGLGVDTLVNPQHDTNELDHFTSAQSVHELQSLLSNDAHGDAVIALGHGDGNTLLGPVATVLHQNLHADHVLLH